MSSAGYEYGDPGEMKSRGKPSGGRACIFSNHTSGVPKAQSIYTLVISPRSPSMSRAGRYMSFTLSLRYLHLSMSFEGHRQDIIIIAKPQIDANSWGGVCTNNKIFQCKTLLNKKKDMYQACAYYTYSSSGGREPGYPPICAYTRSM